MSSPEERVRSGIPGLDEILSGGIPRDSLFLVQGASGTGKTTLGMHFLLEGVRRGDASMLVSNAESPAELDAIASSHGWSLDGIEMTRLVGDGIDGGADPSDYTLFPAAEVEAGATLAHLFAEIERVGPRRLVLDSISGLRVLAHDPAFYRRQLQRLREFLSARACTAILLDDAPTGEIDLRTQTIANGLLELEQLRFVYGAERRRLSVRKLRGSPYLGGLHDFVIQEGGLRVYPRLVASAHEKVAAAAPAASDLAELDALVGGGLPRGTTTLLMGPAGSGKSTLATLYVQAAAARGEKSVVLLFDESQSSWVQRSCGLGMDVVPHLDAGRIVVKTIDPVELTPGQMAHGLVDSIEGQGTRLVVLDTLNGFLHGAVQEQMTLLYLRELLTYLSRRGVVTFLVLTQHGVLGTEMTTPIDVSFLADNVFLMRFFEASGGIRQALSMVKKRSGPHERTIRELCMEAGRIRLSEPLAGLSGVLTGTPRHVSDDDSAGSERR